MKNWQNVCSMVRRRHVVSNGIIIQSHAIEEASEASGSAAKARSDCSGRAMALAGQSPLGLLRPRDQIRLKVSAPSSSKRLA
jgi:hypothetical protein